MSGEDTFSDWHTYELDWTPDQVQWIIDGEVKRTLKKSDTWNAEKNRYQFPQTPARLQMSLWPAGLASNPKGTIDWAGGVIDWNSQDIQQEGYYYATVGQVDVQCYQPPAGTPQTGDNAYIYTNEAALVNDIAITDNSTVLASMGATGLNMNLGAGSSSSAAASASDSVPTNSGGSGGMAAGGAAGSSAASASPSASPGFSQGTGQGNSAPKSNERVLRGSLFAVLVAVVALVAL